MNKKMNNKGFSLVELIIVIAIMAILVGVLAPQFFKYLESSRQSTDMDTVASYKTAVEAAVIDSQGTSTPIASIKLTVSGSGKTISPDSDLSDIGLAAKDATTALKSDGWNDATYTYEKDATTKAYKWTKSVANNKNKNKPEKDLNDVFK